MKRAHAVLALAVAVFLSVPCLAGPPLTVKETYDEGIDTAVWRIWVGDKVLPGGGSPGAYLRTGKFDAAVPQPVYLGPPTTWVGDYRGMNVVSLGIDIRIFFAGIGVDPTRELALLLSSDMGTPDDPTDDCEVYSVNEHKLPQVGGGWEPFDFRVPSDSTTLPPGWVVRGPCQGLSGDDAWNAVITNVTRVSFPFSDPDLMWYFQYWDIGIDNPRIDFQPLGKPMQNPL